LIFTALLGLVGGYVLVATPAAEARAPQGTDLRIFNDLVARANLDKAILADLEACLALLEAACPEVCGVDPVCSSGTCGTFELGCDGSESCFCFAADNPDGSVCMDDFFCSVGPVCDFTSDCGTGATCIIDTCCGTGICVPNELLVCSELQPTQGGRGPTAAGGE
jgi:hypothetical protein